MLHSAWPSLFLQRCSLRICLQSIDGDLAAGPSTVRSNPGKGTSFPSATEPVGLERAGGTPVGHANGQRTGTRGHSQSMVLWPPVGTPQHIIPTDNIGLRTGPWFRDAFCWTESILLVLYTHKNTSCLVESKRDKRNNLF